MPVFFVEGKKSANKAKKSPGSSLPGLSIKR
jgi:hypothetical protein